MKSAPMFKYCLSLAAGILTCLFTSFHSQVYLYSFVLILFTLLLAFVFQKYVNFKHSWLIGIFLLISNFTLGFGLGHYTQSIFAKSFFYTISANKNCHLLVESEGWITEKANSWRVTTNVLKVIDSNNKTVYKTTGRLLLYWPKLKNSKKPDVKCGTHLLISNKVMPMPQAAFPFDFDYKAVMRYKNIQYQAFLDSLSFINLGIKHKGVFYYANLIQQNIVKQLNKIFPTNVSGLAASLSIGYKEDVENTDLQAFGKSGTMHVLAVSGLHVGMIYLLLIFLFTGKTKVTKTKKWISIIIIIILWGYGFITGFGASIVRSCFMFTLIEIGRIFINRKTNSLNILFSAAYFQLLLFPLNLVDVGFQLSYLAVFGIIYLQPKLNELIVWRNKWVKKVWELSNVSIAATITTLPITLYYFHTFPVYFIFSNLILVPLSLGVLTAVFVSLSASFIPFLGKFVILITTYSLKLVLVFVHFFANLPYAQLTNIYLSGFETALFIFLLPFLVGSLYFKNVKGIFACSLVILCLTFYAFLNNHKSQNFTIISEIRNTVLVSTIIGNELVNYSKPIRKGLSDSIFLFQKPFLHHFKIKKVVWKYVFPGFIDSNTNYKFNCKIKNVWVLKFKKFKPIHICVKAVKKVEYNNETFIIQKRNLRYSDSTIPYKILANNYLIYNFKK